MRLPAATARPPTQPTLTRRRLAVAATLGALACSGEPEPGADPGDSGSVDAELVDPLAWSVMAPGPYQTGHQRIDVTYTSVLGMDRTVPVEIWYPTADTDGPPALYIDSFVDAASLSGATAAAPVHDGAFAVHVHSHGYQGFGGSSAFLSRAMASHGWVTIAPNHVGNLLTDHEDPLPTSHYIHKLEDLSQALDAVAAQADALLGAPIEADRFVLSGHSYGAYATWGLAGATFDPDRLDTACSGGGGLHEGACTADERAAFESGELVDPRVVATMPMAGYYRDELFGDAGFQGVQTPVLAMSGSEDGPDGAQAQFDRMDGLDLTWMEIEGGCHQTFGLGAPCPTLDADEGFEIASAYAIAFSRRHLLDDSSDETVGVLDGSVEVDARATVQLR